MPIRDPQGNVLGPAGLGSIHYEYDGYSGSQILVYAGDVLVDNVNAIQFSVNQTRTPVYGYANQYYTFVTNGHVFVQGTLVINFTEAGYLLWPIKEMHNRRLGGRLTSPIYTTDKKGNMSRNQVKTSTVGETLGLAKRSEFMKANVEQSVEMQKDPYSAKSLNNFYRELGALSDDAFEDWAENFEDAIWFGADKNNTESRAQLFSNNISEYDNIKDVDVWNHRRADQYPEIDILISYGDYSKGSANHTVKKLLDVTFIGQSQTIESSGAPVQEVYNFIARNFV